MGKSQDAGVITAEDVVQARMAGYDDGYDDGRASVIEGLVPSVEAAATILRSALRSPDAEHPDSPGERISPVA